jgi:hypothetical protein
MGIDLYCGDITFGCSYSSWNNIRTEIIKATIDYIQDKFEKDKELYGNLSEDDENYIGDGSLYNAYMENLLLFKNNILCQTLINNDPYLSDNKINKLIKCCYNIMFINALNYFELGGLFALCNQSDCEGYYTPGNSLDICSLLNRIEPFVIKYKCYNSIFPIREEVRLCNTVYEVFEYSHKTLHKVDIS